MGSKLGAFLGSFLGTSPLGSSPTANKLHSVTVTGSASDKGETERIPQSKTDYGGRRTSCVVTSLESTAEILLHSNNPTDMFFGVANSKGHETRVNAGCWPG